MNGEQIQHQIDSMREKILLTEALEAARLELLRIEQARELEASRAKYERMRQVVEAAERREAERERIEFRCSCEALPTSHALSVRLAELQPVFTADGVMFPVVTLVPLFEMVDQLRSTAPSLFQGVEPVVAEPSDDEIEAHRRDRWGDVPDRD